MLEDGRLLAAVVRSPPDEVVVIDVNTGDFQKIETLPSSNFRVFGSHVLEPSAQGLKIYDRRFQPVGELTLKNLEGGGAFGVDATFSLLATHPSAGVLGRVGKEVVRIDIERRRVRRLANLPFEGAFLVTTNGKQAVTINHQLAKFATIDLENADVLVHPIRYAGKRGTQICGLNKASDGTIYGTTIISMHIFRHAPKTGKTDDLGHVGWSGGEVYNTIEHGRQIFFGTYGGGFWGHYDPEKPWKPAFKGQALSLENNPKNLGRLSVDDSNAANRPFEYVLGPDKNIYIACRANYGHPGGCLVRFNAQTGEKKVYRDLKRSVQTVTADDRYVYCGTNIRGGRGSGDRADVATFFVHDPNTGKRVFEAPLVDNAKAIVSVRYHPTDRQVYLTTDNQHLLAFDPQTFRVKGRWSIRSAGTPLAGVPEDVGMIHLAAASDGNVYGVTQSDLFRLNTKRKQIEYMKRPPIPELYQIVEGEPGVLYMGARTHLLKYVVNPSPFYR